MCPNHGNKDHSQVSDPFFYILSLLTLYFDAGGGCCFSVEVDRLARVDADVGGPHAVNVQLHQTKVQGRLYS